MLRKFLTIAIATTTIAVSLVTATAARDMGIEEIRTPGGVTAWFKHEPSIPVISVSALWRGGAAADPVELQGISNLVSGLLDEGAGDMDSLAFQTRMEELALRMGFEAGRDNFSGSLETLSENADQAFELFGLALSSPRFDEVPVARIRRQIISGIQRSKFSPNAIAGKIWRTRVFADQPYGRPTNGTEKSVAAITQDDLINFMKTRLGKDNLIIGVVGDVSREKLIELLDKAFGGLPDKAKIAAGADQEIRVGGITATEDYDSPQTVIMFSTPGIRRDDSDYYAAMVMNKILGGGGFSSLLTEEIREKRGLTYGVYSYLSPRDDVGLWMGGLSTSNANTAEALKVLKQTIRDFAGNGPTEQQLADAKANINGSFPLRLTSNRAIAGLLVALQRHNLGKDYLRQRPEFISAVTVDDVKRISARILDLDKLVVVAVGKPEGL